MSSFTSESIPSPDENLPPARRRRQRRMVVPDPGDDHPRLLDTLSERATPGLEFFLSALLSGAIFGFALLIDSPALAILAVLLAPFMGPAIGLALAAIAGSPAFFFHSLVSLLSGGLIYFLCGTLAGIAMRLFPPASVAQAAAHLGLDWPDMLLLSVGVALTAYLMSRTTQARPLVSSLAIAYSLFLPLGASGFSLTSGIDLPWSSGLLVFTAHLLWSALVGTIVLALLGLRPRNVIGYVMGACLLVVCVLAALSAFGLLPAFAQRRPAEAGMISQETPPGAPAAPSTTPSPGVPPTPIDNATPHATPLAPPASETVPEPSQKPTLTLTVTPTRTLVPTHTPTQTVTPQATPVWARINAKDGNGAFIRKEANFDSAVVQVLLNGIIVEVLPDVAESGGMTWVKVRTADGKEGWIVRSLLATATPAPGW